LIIPFVRINIRCKVSHPHHPVPHDVEHALIWSKLPIQHDGLTHPSIAARLAQDGIWGFTGTNEPPPSPSTLHLALPALAEWGVTEDKLIRSPPLTEEEQVHHERACAEVQKFVEYYWHGWETCWFVNPPVSKYSFGFCITALSLNFRHLRGFRVYQDWLTSTSSPARFLKYR
jgi:hypothetical protein